MEAFAFYLFGGVALLSAIGILVSRNIVRTAVCLLGTLGGVGCLYFLLNASFLAAIQFIVYVGGTLILIIFGVMLTTKSPWVAFTPTRRQVAAGCVVAVMLAFGLCMLLLQADWPAAQKDLAAPSVKEIGNMLLTDYLVPFEAASVLLLVVMIGAAYLARGEK
ncbi:MAG TPA: NADH-quinone oxidoreductase subunit J [Phycisphaerae bacterium]|nr:NADH-quinone oxidoreductase subunit J [Phycisphaerae bacterium]